MELTKNQKELIASAIQAACLVGVVLFAGSDSPLFPYLNIASLVVFPAGYALAGKLWL